MRTTKVIFGILTTAAAVFSLNGFVNVALMRPLASETEWLRAIRFHLDDAAFSLLFAFVGVVFLSMFAMLPREKGYAYLSAFSFLSSLQLLSEWDEKTLLLGPIPSVPYDSLAVKSGIAVVAVLFLNYLLRAGRRMLGRIMTAAVGVLFGCIVVASLAAASPGVLEQFNRLFLLLVLANVALHLWQFLDLLRHDEHRTELRWTAYGFILFFLLLLPDIGKDVVESMLGRHIGYLPVWWEECFEDTYPWAFLELVTVFGVLFVRRFAAQNKSLTLEVDTRQRLDRLLTELARAYRLSDLEQILLREGRRYFAPYEFEVVNIREAPEHIRQAAAAKGGRLQAGETVQVPPSTVLCAAGGSGESLLLLAVTKEVGTAPLETASAELEAPQRFALSLMAKYAAIFFDYFRMLETRVQEVEQRSERQPWVSKLFLQMAEKERKRLASDLHDEVLQELLHVRRLTEQAGAAAAGERSSLERIRLGLENAEFMIRDTCHELMPSFLAEQGVLPAIAKLAERTRLRADFQLELTVPGELPALQEEQSVAVYRIVQELIHNADKHSGARRVGLELAAEEEWLYVRYEDDGVGMDAAGLKNGGFVAGRLGLRGIAERVRMLGGELALDTAPGFGLRAECRLPL